jgi:hypothetical protein
MNSDNASFTTNYKSLDKHYTLYAAMVYNRQQNDENGGIVSEDDLLDPRFTDRRTMMHHTRARTASHALR